MYKCLFFAFICFFLFPAFAIFADDELLVEENNDTREDLWISADISTAFYGISSMAYGGGLAVGYGTGISFGFRVAFYHYPKGIETLELSLLLRFYLLGTQAYSGPFAQFMGGPSFFNKEGELDIPSHSGMVSAGICFGWRFIFGKWFVEPAIRGGYPYIFGAGVSGGLRF